MPIRLNNIASFQDETLKDSNYKDVILSILFSQDGFSFTIYDKVKNKFLVLESFRIQTLNKNIVGESFFRHIHAILSIEFEKPIYSLFKEAKTLINLIANQSTWVPLTLFEERNIKDYLNLNFNEVDGVVKYEIINNLNAVCVYSFNESIFNFFKKTFPKAEIHSLQSSLASHFQIVDKKCFEETTVYCYVEATQYFIYIFQNKKFVFTNQFSFQNSRDFAFYLLSVYDKLNLSPDNVPLVFSGDIFNDSEIWQLLLKYIRHIRYLKGNDQFTFSYRFGEIPLHQYFHLFNAISCVLLEDCGNLED